jgi:hypothetical protein
MGDYSEWRSNIPCEICQDREGILETAIRINRIDFEYLWLCTDCLKRRLCAVKRWNTEEQEWQFLKT